MKEYWLTTTEYLEPSVASGADAYGVLLLRLLLLEPGTNPLYPEMGVGLGPKYRFITEDDISTLESRISDQINTYLPSEAKSIATVTLKMNQNHYLRIIIMSDNTKYVYDTENSNTPIELSNMR